MKPLTIDWKLQVESSEPVTLLNAATTLCVCVCVVYVYVCIYIFDGVSWWCVVLYGV